MSLLRDRLANLPAPDAAAAAAVAARASDVIRPPGALSRLDDVAAWVGGWHGTATPRIDRPAALVFAADHGIAAASEVSAFPAEVTAAMVEAFEQGVATMSVFARQVGATVQVVDVGVGRPTGDIRAEPALTSERFDQVAQAAFDAVDRLDGDLLVLGELGIGNTTASAAVSAALLGHTRSRALEPNVDEQERNDTQHGRHPEHERDDTQNDRHPERERDDNQNDREQLEDDRRVAGDVGPWVGRGTGVDDRRLAAKRRAVAEAVRRVHDLGITDPLDVLRHVGGAELVAMAAAVVAARHRRIPVLLDGYICTASALPVHEAEPSSLHHCIVGHRSAEPGHRLLLEHLGKEPLLDLDMRLGEGSGAMAAVPLVRLACAGVTEVATFGEFLGP